METAQEAHNSSKKRHSRLSNLVPRMSTPNRRRWRYEPQTFPYPAQDRRTAWTTNPGPASSWGNQSNGPGFVDFEAAHPRTVHIPRPAPSSNVFDLWWEIREPGPAGTNLETHQFLEPEPLPPSIPSTCETRSGTGKKPVVVWPDEEEEEEEGVVEFAPNFRSAEPKPSEKSSSSFCGPLALHPRANTEGVRWKSSRPSQCAQTWDEATRTRAGHHFRPSINELHLHLEELLQPQSIQECLNQIQRIFTLLDTPIILQGHFADASRPRASSIAPVIEIRPSFDNIEAECFRVAQKVITIRQMQEQELIILRQSELLCNEQSIIHTHELASLQAQEQALLERLQELQMEIKTRVIINWVRKAEVRGDLIREGNMNFLSEEVDENEEHGERWDPYGYGRTVDLDLDRLSLEEEDEYHPSAHRDREHACTDPKCQGFEEDNLEHHPPTYKEDYHSPRQQSFHSLFSNTKSMNAYPLVDIDSFTFSNAKAQFRTYEERWRSILSSAPSTSFSTSKSTPISPTNQSTESRNQNQNTSTQIPYPLLSPPTPVSFPPMLTGYIAASPTFISKAASHTFFCLSFNLTPTITPPPLFSTSASNPSTVPTLSFDFPSPKRAWSRDPEDERAERDERRKKLQELRAQLKREKVHWHSDRLTLYFGSEAAKTEKAKSVWSVVVELKKGVDSAIEKMDQETELA